MELASTPPWWLTTRTCDLPSAAATGVLEWAAFLFLSSCSQRLMLSAASAAFLAVVLCLAVHKLLSRRRDGAVNGNGNGADKPLLDRGRARVRVGAGFVVALAASAVLAGFYGVLFVLSVVMRGGEGEVQEAVFLALQCTAHLAAAALVGHEKRFRAAAHPLALRLFWLADAALLAGAAAARLASGAGALPDDALSIAALVLSLPLPIVAVSGATGIIAVTAASAEEEEEAED